MAVTDAVQVGGWQRYRGAQTDLRRTQAPSASPPGPRSPPRLRLPPPVSEDTCACPCASAFSPAPVHPCLCRVQAAAKRVGVELRSYSIIYDLIDDVRAAMEGRLKSGAPWGACGACGGGGGCGVLRWWGAAVVRGLRGCGGLRWCGVEAWLQAGGLRGLSEPGGCDRPCVMHPPAHQRPPPRTHLPCPSHTPCCSRGAAGHRYRRGEGGVWVGQPQGGGLPGDRWHLAARRRGCRQARQEGGGRGARLPRPLGGSPGGPASAACAAAAGCAARGASF